MSEKIRAEIEKSLRNLPYVFVSSPLRREIDGISAGGFNNLRSQGKAPQGFLVGKKIAIEKSEYIEWLVARIEAKS